MPDAVPEMRDWGLPRPGELERVVILSPHLDDAVLGCGRFMAAHSGVTVVTVYAGAPETYPEPMSRWDTLSGFIAGDDVLGARRSEDAAALRELGAAPRWLDFVEHQYLDRSDWVGATETHETLEAELRALTPTAILAPFGLANPDHDATHDAAMVVRSRYLEPSWFLYEDFGYLHIPGLLARRVSQLFRAGVWPTPVLGASDLRDEHDVRKRGALAHYESQCRALEAEWQLHEKLGAPEQLWRLGDPPAGWEGLMDTA